MFHRDIYVVPSQETCESGCVLPHSLSIEVLWARLGPLDIPQNYILGARYLFQCQNFKVCSLHLTFFSVFSDKLTFNIPLLLSLFFVFFFLLSVLCHPLSL